MFKSNRQRLKGKLLNTVKHFIWKALLFSLSTNFQLVVCTLKTSQPICICRSGGPFPVLWCTFEPRGSKLKFSASTVTWTGTGPGIPTPRPAQQNSLCPTLQAWKQWQYPFTSFQISRKSEDRPTGPVTPSTVTLVGEKVRQMTKGLIGRGIMRNQKRLSPWKSWLPSCSVRCPIPRLWDFQLAQMLMQVFFSFYTNTFSRFVSLRL